MVRAFLFVCLFSCLTAVHAAPEPLAPIAGALDIRVEGRGWGNVGPEQIEPVLQAVAAELMARLPRKFTAPIVVTHTNGNPIALYDRGEGGAYQVQLHASDARWHLYVFEFAHEFCHLLSNYDKLGPARHNQWFEESLCETASLFALDRLSTRWERSQVAEWRQRAPRLRRFYEYLANEEHRSLPADVAPAAWLSGHEAQLRGNPYLRDKNDLVAKLMLPFFEREPDSWDALGYLNLEPDDAQASLANYLRRWYERAPATHKGLISRIRGLLAGGNVASADAPAAATTSTAPAIAAAPAR